MIIYYLLVAVGTILSAFTSWLPIVEELPLGMDNALSTAVGWIRYLQTVLWPLNVIIACFLWYAAFKVSLMVIKLFIGHRAPQHR